MFLIRLISFQVLFGGVAQAQHNAISTSTGRASPQTQAPTSLYSGSFTTSIENGQITDADTRENLVEVSLGADIKYQPIETLRFDLSPRFKYASGFIQDDSSQPSDKSYVTVRNASVVFTPVFLIQLEAGAVDQSRVHNRLLLDSSPFPAAVVRLRTGEKKDRGFSAEIVSEYAIPTSSSLSSNTQELEKTPSFSSVGSSLEFSNSRFTSEFGAHYFQFKDIPNSVANASGIAGNTVEAMSGTSRRFKYEYEGVSASFDTKFRLGRRFLLGMNADWIRNSKAPSNLSQGYRASVKGMIRLNATSVIIPEFEFFRLEPDTFIASYANFKYQTNRTGYRTGLGYSYKKAIKVATMFGERVPLFESPTQSREKTLDLTLETSHALF